MQEHPQQGPAGRAEPGMRLLCWQVLEAWQEGLEANVSNEAQTLLSSQIRLYSYCKVVGKIVTDEVHKTARVQLMNKVAPSQSSDCALCVDQVSIALLLSSNALPGPCVVCNSSYDVFCSASSNVLCTFLSWSRLRMIAWDLSAL